MINSNRIDGDERPPFMSSVVEGVGIMSIDRPAARNAIDQVVAGALCAAVDEFELRDDVKAMVLTGTHGNFSAGMDLRAYARGERPSVPGRGLAGLTLFQPTKPLLAAVEGFALAGGFELALSADIVIASRTAVFGLPEVQRGLVASGGGLLRIAKAVPFGAAMELALTGDRLTADDAARLGLVTRLVDEGDALDEAVALAKRIASMAPMAVRATKQIVYGASRWLDREEYSWMRSIAEPVMTSHDAREGAAAFLERRDPVWRGE